MITVLIVLILHIPVMSVRKSMIFRAIEMFLLCLRCCLCAQGPKGDAGDKGEPGRHGDPVSLSSSLT